MDNKKDLKQERIDYNADMQELFLVMMLTDGELFTRCQNILRPEYFEKPLQPVVKLFIDHSEKYKGLPTPELIKATINYPMQKLEKIDDSLKEWFIDSIEKFCRHMAIKDAIFKSSDMLNQGYYGDVESIIKEAVLLSLNRDLGTSYFKDPRKRLEELISQNGTISTGWKSIDDIVYNLGKGELVIFTAVTGGGKSVALQNLAWNWALQKYNVVYFSLELDERLVCKRIDSMVTNIPNIQIFKNLDKVELILKNKKQNCGSIEVKYVKPGTNTNDLRAYIKEYQIINGFKPDMIIVDYLDMMYPNSKRVDPSNFFVKDKLVSEELRGLGGELSMIVATACQINRGGYDEMAPGPQNTAGGISKIFTSDLTINVNNTVAARERGEITFQLTKTRNSGGVGKSILMRYNMDTLRITDMDAPDEYKRHAETRDELETIIENNPVIKDELVTVPISEVTKIEPKLSPALQRILDKTRNQTD